MKFGLKLIKKLVPEWKEVYINYNLCKRQLKVFKLLKSHHQKLVPQEFDEGLVNKKEYYEDMAMIMQHDAKFLDLINMEIDKVNCFFKVKLHEIVQTYELIKINILIYDLKRDSFEKEQIKYGMQQFYKKIVLLYEFIDLNYEGFRKIIKKHNKMVKLFEDGNNFKRKLNVDELFNERTKFKDEVHFLKNIEDKLKTMYIDTFFNNYNKLKAHTELRQLTQEKIISRKETNLFFFFAGGVTSLVFILFAIILEGSLHPDHDDRFMQTFEMFRGIGLIILYWWFLAWNVYGWTSYQINYSLIFNFKYHMSTVNQIVKRCAFFSFFFLIMFISYIVFHQKDFIEPSLNIFPRDYSPILVWLLFLFYLFFPSKKYFNGRGRSYLWDLCCQIFCFTCYQIDFRIIWTTDQLISFAIPLQDFEFTLCYFFQKWKGNDPLQQCHSRVFSFGFTAAMIPYMLRIIQCFRIMRNTRCYKGPEMVNFCKYLLSLSVVIASFITGILPFSNKWIAFWAVLAACSSIYSFVWDLKYDWGFFQKDAQHKFLREKLSYSQPHIYYLAMFFNLILRFAWVLSISPDILRNHIKAEFLTFVVAFLEILRRAIWNFFRVEKEHIINCGVFRALAPLSLPFQELTVLAGDNFNRKEESNRKELTPFDSISNPKESGLRRNVSNNLKTIEEENSSDVAKKNSNKILAAYDKNFYEGAGTKSSQIVMIDDKLVFNEFPLNLIDRKVYSKENLERIKVELVKRLKAAKKIEEVDRDIREFEEYLKEKYRNTKRGKKKIKVFQDDEFMSKKRNKQESDDSD